MISPKLLRKVIGIERTTIVLVIADGVVFSIRPMPALSRLACITPVAIAVKSKI